MRAGRGDTKVLQLYARVGPGELEGARRRVRRQHELEQLERGFARGGQSGDQRDASALAGLQAYRATQRQTWVEHAAGGAAQRLPEAHGMRLLQRAAAAQE